MKRGGEINHRPLRVKTRDTRCRSVIDVFVSSRVDYSLRRLALIALRGLAGDQCDHASDQEEQYAQHQDVEADRQRLRVAQAQTITQKGECRAEDRMDQNGQRHESAASP